MIRSHDNLSLVESEIGFSDHKAVRPGTGACRPELTSWLLFVKRNVSLLVEAPLTHLLHTLLRVHTYITLPWSIRWSNLAKMPAADMNRRWSRPACRGRTSATAAGLAGGDVFDGSARREVVALPL